MADPKPLCLLWVDAVEKDGGQIGVRSNRIKEPRSLNQPCANDWFFDSRLRRGAPKIFFQRHRSKAEVALSVLHVRSSPLSGL
jgi:hypothetical protein